MELYTSQILQRLKNEKHFIGVFARDNLPKKIKYPSALVFNSDTSDKPGEHWLAIYWDKKGRADFFDSFGRPPSHFDLESYLDKTSTSWRFNNKQIQHIRSSLCGYYCILFLLYRFNNKKMNLFKSRFKSYTLFNDFLLLNLMK